jgi:hypothetical protein
MTPIQTGSAHARRRKAQWMAAWTIGTTTRRTLVAGVVPSSRIILRRRPLTQGKDMLACAAAATTKSSAAPLGLGGRAPAEAPVGACTVPFALIALAGLLRLGQRGRSIAGGAAAVDHNSLAGVPA